MMEEPPYCLVPGPLYKENRVTTKKSLGFTKTCLLEKFHCLEAYQCGDDGRDVAIGEDKPDKRHHDMVDSILAICRVCQRNDHKVLRLA